MDQTLGVGDGTRTGFGLVKRYGDIERRITKPVEGSVMVAVAGVAVSADGFVVDAATGVVTLETAPPVGAVVTAGFSFDVPVRFDADRIEVTLESFEAGRMAAVPLIEVRV